MGDRLNDGVRARCWIVGLEDAGPDEDAFSAELHHERGVGGRRDATGGEVHDRQAAQLSRLAHLLVGGAQRLCLGHQLLFGHGLESADAVPDGAHVAHRLHDVAGAGFAFRAHHRGAFADAAERLPEVTAAADEGNLERVLVDVVTLVRGGEHLGLVDIIHAHRFEQLRLDEVADATLRHHGDGDGVHDARDHVGVGHAGDAAG